MKKVLFVFLIMTLSFFSVNGVAAESLVAPDKSGISFCTMEAKMCTDGKTFVSRTAPNCEFAKCPNEICTKEYAPVCGDTGIRCITTPCDSTKTFSNKCMMEAAGAKYLYAGECEDNTKICTREYVPVCGQPKMPECPAGAACIMSMPLPKTYGNKCNLESDGAKFLYNGTCKKDYLQVPDLALISISLNDLTNIEKGDAFKVSSKIKIKGFEKGILIPWIAELRNTRGTLLDTCSGTVTRSSTDTSSDGSEYMYRNCTMDYFKNYDPKGERYRIIVKLDKGNNIAESNEKNNSASKYTIIGNDDTVVCSKIYSPVCGQPKQTCSGKVCTLEYKLPQTYSNKCTLEAAGATFLYNGRCKNIEPPVCPVYTLVDPREGCYYEYEENNDGCKVPKLVCEDDDIDLDNTLKRKIDSAIIKFERKLNSKFNSDANKIKHIETIVSKLEKIKGNTNSEKLVNVIRYLILKLNKLKTKYSSDDLDDILDILK